MAASPRDGNAGADPPTTAISIADLPPLRAPSSNRVVSVSPTDVESGAQPAESDQPAGGLFLTPRVLDQNAFDDLAGALRELLERAGESASRLEALISDAAGLAGKPAAGAAQLQERLRLGARMLKAFQSQIDHAGQSIDRLSRRREEAEARLNEAVEAAVQRIDEQLSRQEAAKPDLTEFQQKLDSLVQSALQRLEAGIAQRESRLPKVDDIGRMFHELTHDAMDRIETRIGEFERELPGDDELEARLSELAGAAVERFESRLAKRHAALEVIDDRLSQLRQEADGLKDAITRTEARCTATGGRIDELDAATEKLQPAAELLDRMETVIRRLVPWERLLLGSEIAADGLPRPVATMIESLREGIGHDMAQLSATMRELAQRVEDLGLPASSGQSSPPEVVTVSQDPEDHGG